MPKFRSSLTEDETREMWAMIAGQELIRCANGKIQVQSIIYRLYPAAEIGHARRVLEDHTMDYEAAEREYAAGVEFAVPAASPEEEAREHRQRMLALGQLDMFDTGKEPPNSGR